MQKKSANLYSKNKKLFLIVLFAFFIYEIQAGPFCNAICHDYVQTCFDITENSCYVCAQSIYKNKDFTNPYNDCVPKDQRRVFFKELNSNNMSLAGYSTSTTHPKVCGNLSFSG